MSTLRNSPFFFKNGSSCHFKFCLDLYPQALKIKEAQKCKEGDLIRLDKWYQNELPETIKKRGRNAHIVHKELVQAMKWKQTRGKFFPQLTYLIKLNTDRTVFNETKKAFKKLPNLEQAVTALSSLKGVGVSMASALLSAACPQNVPFMADECLLAIPEIGAIDYTTSQYLQFVQHIHEAVNRLNATRNDSEEEWNAHTVELSLWTHYIISKSYPSLLEDMPNQYSNISTTMTATEHSFISYCADQAEIIPSIQFPSSNIPKVNGDRKRSSLGLSTSSMEYLFDAKSEKKLKSNLN
ncbi:hypothetical protein ACFFRR_009681 [Megaselia abdita]